MGGGWGFAGRKPFQQECNKPAGNERKKQTNKQRDIKGIFVWCR